MTAPTERLPAVDDDQEHEQPGESGPAGSGLRGYALPDREGLRELAGSLAAGSGALAVRGWTWLRGEGGQEAWARAGYIAGSLYLGGHLVVSSPALEPYTGYAVPLTVGSWCVGAWMCSPTLEARKKARKNAAADAAREACPDHARGVDEPGPVAGAVDDSQEDQEHDGQGGGLDEPEDLTLAEAVGILDAAYEPGANGLHLDRALSRAQSEGLLTGWKTARLRAAVETAGIPVRDQIKVAGRGGCPGVHHTALTAAREQLLTTPAGGPPGPPAEHP
ncbi:hypothetical protein, partial [Streptomyces sp. NPDC001889]